MNLRQAICLVILASAGMARPQSNHSQLIFDSSGTDQAAYGANEVITISGNITYYGRRDPRPEDGAVDYAQPFTDIYIVEHGTHTGGFAPRLELKDVNDVPNTIFGSSGGSFIEQPIGTTMPSGALKSGEYDVVFDEHQDGAFQSDFDLYNGYGGAAIVVNIPFDAPVPPPTGILLLKLQATQQMVSAAGAREAFKAFTKFTDPQAALLDVYTKWVLGTATPADFAFNIIGALSEPVGLAITIVKKFATERSNVLKNWDDYAGMPLTLAENVLENRVKRVTGMAADPPDPNYGQSVLPAPATVMGKDIYDPLNRAWSEMMREMDRSERLSAALLAALEKYQGAQGANGYWALAHARECRHFAMVLADQMGKEVAAMTAFRAALASHPFDLDAMAAALRTRQARLAATGFSPEEKLLLAAMGTTGAEADAIMAELLAETHSFSKTTALSKLDAELASLAAGPARWRDFAATWDGVITTLLAEPTIDDGQPLIVLPAGVTGAARTPLSFTAQVSQARSLPLTVDWDFDEDGEFDDAAGTTVQNTWQGSYQGLVGARVTSSGGRTAYAWMLVTVTDANRRPAFTSLSPLQGLVVGEGAAPLVFGAAANDPDGDAVTLAWSLDNVPVGTGNSYTWTPAATGEGHVLRVTAGDGKSKIERTWIIAVKRTGSPAPADLALNMEASGTPIQTGSEFTWTMTLENHGPGAAANVVLTQALPEGLTFVRSSTSFGTATAGGNQVTANFGTVAPGGVVTLWVQTTAAAPGSYQCAARVASDAMDFDTANNSASARVRVNAPSPQAADLSLSAAVAPSPATVGGTQTISFTTSNAGPDTATGLVLETQLPDSVDFVSSTPAVLSSDDGLVRIPLPDTGSGADTIATLIVRPTQAGSGPAYARVFASQGDPGLANNATEMLLSAVFVTPPASDLVVTQTPPVSPRAGLPATWTITVTNNGPDAAEQVSLNDVLPAGAVFSGATPAPASLGNGRAGFTMGTLASGASRSVFLTVEPQAAGEAVNRVTASSASRDANGASASSEVTVQPAPSSTANLAAALSVSAPSAPLNTNITLTLTISNAGPDAATDVIARTNLPSGLTFLSATGGATYANGIVTAAVTPLASGASTSLTITATTAAAAPYVLLSTVSSSNLDPDEANNRATASLLVNDPNAGIAIVRNFAAPEIEVLRTWLTEMGFTSQVFDQEGLTFDVLKNFKLVIWDDLGSAAGGIVAADVDLYQALTDRRVPLYFIGDDLARTTTLLAEPHATRWSQLIRLKDFVPGTAIPTFQIFTPGHPLVAGPYGNVSAPFTLGGDTDRDEHIDFADVVGINLLAHCAPLTKARRVTQNWLPTPAPTPRDQAGIVFKNSVAWLLASHTPADLAVTQSARSQVNLGGTIRIAATVTNRGPGAAGDVTLTNILPTGLGFSTVVADRGTAAFAEGKLTVRLGSLVAGESVSFEIMLTAEAAGRYQYELMADACVPDNNASDNRSTLPILVVPVPPVTLKATYRFDDTLAACEPDAAPLVAIDPANADAFLTTEVNGRTRRVYRWDGSPDSAASQAGLKLNTAGLLPRDNYSVEMLFRFTEANNATRFILQTANRTGDHSLYVSPQNRLVVSPLTEGPASFTTGKFHHVTLTVSAGTVTTWLDGVLQRTETTANLDISPEDLLHFFAGAAPEEYADGEIALLRVYEGALPPNRIAAQAAYPFGPDRAMDVNRDLNAVLNPIGVWMCGISEARGTPFLPSPNPFAEPRWFVWNWSSTGPHIARNRTGASLSWATIIQPPDLLCMDPSYDGRNAVARWTAPVGGTYRIQGRWQGIDVSPNGTDAALLKNGSIATTLFETYVLGFGQARPFDVTVTVAMGETVDFSLGRGGNSQYFDSTGLDAVITPLMLTDDCADGTDLAVTHKPPAKIIGPGETFMLEMSVTNAGLRPAPGVFLTDVIPAGLTFVSASAEQGTVQQSGNEATITLGTLAPGESRSVSVLLSGNAAGVYTNTARVGSGSFDPAQENNEATATVTLGGVAPLAATVRTTVNSVMAGGEAVFELVMVNGGTFAAPGCLLSAALPAGTTFVSATGGGTLQNGTIVFPVRSLAVGETAGYSLRLRPSVPGPLTLTAMASSTSPSVRESTGSASLTILPATVPPDLQVAVSTTPAQFYAGCRFTATYTVTNASPTPAAHVTLRGFIPATLVVITTTASQGTATVTGGQLNAALGRVLQGTPVTVTVEALATAAEATGLSASVSGVHPFTALPATLRAGLIHLWEFDETAGAATSSTVLKDLIGGAHGTVRGAGALSTGTGVKLPGGDQNSAAYIDLPNGLISPLKQVTFESWVAINATGGNFSHILSFGSSEPGGANGEVFGPGNTNGGGWYGLDYISLTACVGTDYNAQRFAVRNADPNGGGEPYSDSAGPTTLGQLVHIVVTADSSTAGSTTFRYYRDGLLRSQLDNVPFNLSDLNDVNNWLGRGNYTDYASLAATFEEFRLYDRPLTPGEIEMSRLAGPGALSVTADPAISNPSTASAFIRRNITLPPPGSPCAIPVALAIFPVPEQQSYRLEWSATPGRKFLIQSSPDLQRWINVPSLYTATQANETWTDPGPPATERAPALEPERFYRVLELAE